MELFRQATDGGSSQTKEAAANLDRELVCSRFCDERLGRRFRRLARQLATKLGQSIPLACQDWPSTKAAYRFLSNPRVNEGAILAGHFQATRERMEVVQGSILVLPDTTQFTYARESPEAIGVLHRPYAGRGKDGRPRQHTVCGVLMHSSLAVTTEGLPLGLTAIKFCTRSEFKGANALKRKVNPTRVPIEAKERGSLAGEPEAVDRVARGAISVRPYRGSRKRHLRVVLRCPGKRHEVPGAHLCRPLGWRRQAHDCGGDARREGEGDPSSRSPGRERDSAGSNGEGEISWKVETFHKILKTGCRAGASRLRTAERIANQSCAAACHVLQISSLGSSWAPDMWAIEWLV